MIAQPISVGKLVLPRLDASKSIKAILFIAAGDIDIAAVAAEYSWRIVKLVVFDLDVEQPAIGSYPNALKYFAKAIPSIFAVLGLRMTKRFVKRCRVLIAIQS